jgi:hypothetical protein
MRARELLIAALVLAGIACGNSREEKVLDEAEAQCFALTAPGTTLDAASTAMRGAQVFLSPSCDPALVALPSNDRCAPAEDDARCEMFWYFYTASVCSPAGGCCGVCEARVLRSDVSQNGGGAAVCASNFYRRQPCL